MVYKDSLLCNDIILITFSFKVSFLNRFMCSNYTKLMCPFNTSTL